MLVFLHLVLDLSIHGIVGERFLVFLIELDLAHVSDYEIAVFLRVDDAHLALFACSAVCPFLKCGNHLALGN